LFESVPVLFVGGVDFVVGFGGDDEVGGGVVAVVVIDGAAEEGGEAVEDGEVGCGGAAVDGAVSRGGAFEVVEQDFGVFAPDGGVGSVDDDAGEGGAVWDGFDGEVVWVGAVEELCDEFGDAIDGDVGGEGEFGVNAHGVVSWWVVLGG